jgi:hypothetical protein
MTITYSIDHCEASVEDVSLEVAAKSSMILQGISTDKNGEISAVYGLPSGDPRFPATITYRTTLQRRNGGTTRRLSTTFQTWATASNDVTGLDDKKEISITWSMLIPSDMTLEIADLKAFVGNGFSYLYPSVTSKVFATTWLMQLLYGLPEVK